MSGYKNFALVGAGLVGTPIIEELLKLKVSGSVDKVVLLTRPESVSKYEALAARGATITPVADYTSVPDIAKALTGIDVVISTLSHTAYGVQIPLATGAKEAGVKLFVPSEWGSRTDNATEGLFAMKKELTRKIREDVGIPTSVFFTGGFADWIWNPVTGLDVKSGSVTAGGDGNAKTTFTSREDIARYVAYVLTTLPPAETKNKIFRIEGENASLNEVFAQYEKKHGGKLQVKYIPLEELKEKVKQNPRDILSFLQLVWATGGGVVGSPTDNGLFPDWNPKTSIDYL